MQEKTIAHAIQWHLAHYIDDMLMGNIEALNLAQKGVKLFKPFDEYSRKADLIAIVRGEASRVWKARQYAYDWCMPDIYKGLINTFMQLQLDGEFMTDEKYLRWWSIGIRELASYDVGYLKCNQIVFWDDLRLEQMGSIDMQHTILRRNLTRGISTTDLRF